MWFYTTLCTSLLQIRQGEWNMYGERNHFVFNEQAPNERFIISKKTHKSKHTNDV